MGLRDRVTLWASQRIDKLVVQAMTSHNLYQAVMGERLRHGDEEAVTPLSAMQLSAVFACVRVLSEDTAKLPLHLYRKKERGREKLTDHPALRVMTQPNPWQTGFEFREMMETSLELTGMFLALKTIVRGEVRELIPVPIQRWSVEHDGTRYKFTVYMPNGQTLYPTPSNVMFLKGLSLDGVTGVSPITYHRETINLGRNLTKYGDKLFKNGAMVGGALEHPGPAPLSDEAYRRLKESFEEKYAGIGNAHKTILLEEGVKYTPIAMKSTDAQYLESRKFNRTEIASIFRVPPHLIGDLERATFSNIEQQSREYVQNALLPRLVRLEQRMAMELLSVVERTDLYFKHEVNALMRGSYTERMAGYNVAINSGWLTRNEVRELEDLNPGPAELDEYLTPMNMQSSNDPNATPPSPTKTAS